jgi:hypothetical protein
MAIKACVASLGVEAIGGVDFCLIRGNYVDAVDGVSNPPFTVEVEIGALALLKNTILDAIIADAATHGITLVRTEILHPDFSVG